MLCPEVWDFKAPHHNFKVFKSDSTTKNIETLINKHYFNHSICVVLPDTTNLPNNIFQSFEQDNDYYRVNNLSAHELVDKEFIEAFVKTGEVNLLAIECRIDVDNTLALSPLGELTLLLNKEDFQSLGIDGTPSFFERKIKSKFVVAIDLKAETFTPGKKNYEHVRSCLANNLNQKFDVVVSWDPPDEKLCPSSIAAWFDKRGYDVKLCHQKKIDRCEYSLKIPVLNGGADNEKLFEWLGIFAVGGDLKSNDENFSYVNSYQCPEPSLEVGQARCLRWTGFVSRKQIEGILEELKCYLKERESVPWGAMDVQGFLDAPTSWGTKEHNFYMDGDNSYAIFVKPNGQFVLRSSLSSNNKLRIRQ